MNEAQLAKVGRRVRHTSLHCSLPSCHIQHGAEDWWHTSVISFRNPTCCRSYNYCCHYSSHNKKFHGESVTMVLRQLWLWCTVPGEQVCCLVVVSVSW